MIALGTIAPDFTAETTIGSVNFHEYVGDSWCVFFSYPRNFSGVCMTELGMGSRMQDVFAARNTKLLAISIADSQKQKDWSSDFAGVQGCDLNFPLVADPNAEVATLYQMMHPAHAEGITCRSLFIIDPNKKIRFYAMYPASVGRNFDEIVRIIDSLQVTDKHGLATPANWTPGNTAVIPPAMADDAAKVKYPQGFDTLAPYLRMTTVPK